MSSPAVSSDEDDLPSLNELLARKRAGAVSTSGDVRQPVKPRAGSATPQSTVTALPTSIIACVDGGGHSTPALGSPRRYAAPAASTTAEVSPAHIYTPDIPSSPTDELHSALAEELFPPSPPAPFAPPSNLQHYRERSPSIISDSEPDLPSPVQRRTLRSSAIEENSAARSARRVSRDSVWVEDSEDERVRIDTSGTSASSSAQEEQYTPAKAVQRRDRTSLAVYSLESDDEQLFMTRAGSAQNFGDDLRLDDSPGFMTSSATPFLSAIADTPRAVKPIPVPRTTTPGVRRRITISIIDSDSSDSEEQRPTNSRPTPKRTGLKSASSDAEILIVDHEDREDLDTRQNLGRSDETVSLPAERTGGGTPHRSRSETPEEDFDVMDPNDGVLIYEPTPRSRKPTKLSPSLGNTPVASPSRSTGRAHKPLIASKRTTSIDLTTSSDDDDSQSDLERPNRPNGVTTLFPPPRAAPKDRSSPTPTPSSTPRRSTKPSASTPARPAALKTSTPAILNDAQRESLPLALIRELDRAVFRKRWDGLRCNDRDGESTGPGLPDGIEVKWNKKLRNTAGRASWKRVKSGGTTTHVCSIDLATKVTDTEDKLRHTLAHELCHIAAWILSGEIKPPHGDAFKLWSKRIMSVRPDISITTTHSYEITYKYRWKCLNGLCGKTFSRHSRSIDPSAQGCPCGARLAEIDANGAPKIARRVPAKKSEWQEYLTLNSPLVRRENPSIRNEDVFKLVAERYRASKTMVEAAEGAGAETALESAMEGLGV